MQTKEYKFTDQHSVGVESEKILDKFFSRWYFIQDAAPEMQREGIDRLFIPKNQVDTQFPKLIEYKSDFKNTGRAFIETQSVVRKSQIVKGWLNTSKADWLVYFAVYYETAFVCSLQKMQEMSVEWSQKYQLGTCQNSYGNHPYKSIGLLVPLQELMLISDAIFKIKQEKNK